jgi:hypothetical protein
VSLKTLTQFEEEIVEAEHRAEVHALHVDVLEAQAKIRLRREHKAAADPDVHDAFVNIDAHRAR